MENNAEYNNLIRQRNNAQSNYNSCVDRIGECEYLLGRLRPIKEIITEQKSRFRDVKNADNNLQNRNFQWRGQTNTSFDWKMDNVTEENERYYKDSLDHILDTLNNEITRIENQKMNEYGLLGQLGSMINSLGNKIENFFN